MYSTDVTMKKQFHRADFFCVIIIRIHTDVLLTSYNIMELDGEQNKDMRMILLQIVPFGVS